MSPNPIEPALSAEEWARGFRNTWTARVDQSPHPHPGDQSHGRRLIVNTGAVVSDEKRLDRHECAALIALANAALPDTDDRKITREQIVTIRFLASTSENLGVLVPTRAHVEAARRFADALASYLPPETP